MIRGYSGDIYMLYEMGSFINSCYSIGTCNQRGPLCLCIYILASVTLSSVTQ